jgi:hypothetical protein
MCDMRAKSPASRKGDQMAVSIVLDLTDDVSTASLRQFLSLIPEDFDQAEDLRVRDPSATSDDRAPRFLQVLLPSTSEE